MDGRTESIYPKLPAAPAAAVVAPPANNNDATPPFTLSVINSFETAQAHDRKKAIIARENSKTLTAAQIFATLSHQQKKDLFNHYMQKLIATQERLAAENLPYADLAKQAQEQLLAAYHDKVFKPSHLPDDKDIIVITQHLVNALDAPLTIDGAPNQDLLTQLSEFHKLSESFRTNARLETFFGIAGLLLATLAAAAIVAAVALSLGTLVLPTMACVVGLWVGTGTLTAAMLGAGVTSSASLFHDARRYSGLANVLQPLAEKMTEHVSPAAPVAGH